MTQAPLLSLILCSRNDRYLGNSHWRLETTLNYTGERVRALGRSADVEIVVADWGSETPLRESVALGPAASAIVSFMTVPPDLARRLQNDSPFPEVLALNAAARRARGRYVGRIDQDTLVGDHFLQWFFDMIEHRRPIGEPPVPSEQALLFANRRSIPYRFAAMCPPLNVVSRFVAWFGRRLHIETGRVFYNIDVGIWLLYRDLWEECGGYDERMIYMNDMEIDMATRLMTRYPMVNLGALVGYDFYHLDHYHPGASRSSSTHRRVNQQAPREPRGFRPNGADWGLVAYEWPLESSAARDLESRRRASDVALFVLLAAYTGVRVMIDRLVYPAYPRWKRRAVLAWAAVRQQPLVRWPQILWKLWSVRPSASVAKSTKVPG